MTKVGFHSTAQPSGQTANGQQSDQQVQWTLIAEYMAQQKPAVSKGSTALMASICSGDVGSSGPVASTQAHLEFKALMERF